MLGEISNWLLEDIDSESIATTNSAVTYATGADAYVKDYSKYSDNYSKYSKSYGDTYSKYNDYTKYSKYNDYTKYSKYSDDYSKYSKSYSNYSNYSNTGYTDYTNYSNSTYLKITSNPSAQVVDLGNSVTFSVTVQGASGNYTTYQWYKASSETDNGTVIHGATTNSYTFTPDSSDSGSYYYCVVKHAFLGSLVSNRALLTVRYFRAVTLKVCVGRTLAVGVVKLPKSSTISSASSSNTSVATVDSSGNITGVSPGTVTITLVSSNGLSSDISVVVMSDNIINRLYTIFFNIAEAIRAKKNITNALYPNQMANALNGSVTSSSYTSLGALFTDIADKARSVSGTSGTIKPENIYKIICDSIEV